MPNSWKKIITSGSNAQLNGLYVKNNSQFNGDLIVTNLSQTSDIDKKIVVFDTTDKRFYYTSSLPVGVSSNPVFPFDENSVTQLFDGTPQFAGSKGASVITGSLILKPSGGGYSAPFGPVFGQSEIFHEQVLAIHGTTHTIVPANTISFFGTASHATQSISASYTENVSTASFATESRTVFVDNEETSTNNHYFLMVDSGPKYTSASYSTKLYINPNTGNISGSLTGTSSYALYSSESLSASFASSSTSASYASSSLTASFALNIPEELGGLWYNGTSYWSSSLQDNGNVTKIGIGRQPINYSLEVNGTMAATADVIAFMSSDKRLKDNIKPIEDPIGKIKQIGGYSFNWNNKQNIYKGNDFGVIAQEIEKVLPSLVQNREDGYKGVKYDKIVSLLIEAIKDQQNQIDELKNQINNA